MKEKNKKKITTEYTEFHGGKMIFVSETPSCPQDSGTPWLILGTAL
jgi:hypothetical protein